jgi:hypothetical protein
VDDNEPTPPVRRIAPEPLIAEVNQRDRLDVILTDTVDPARLRSYWAHWTLSRLDWTISNFPTADIDLFLQLGESRL